MYEELGPNCNHHVSVPRRGGITMGIWLGPGQGGWKRERDALGGKALCGSQGSGSGGRAARAGCRAGRLRGAAVRCLGTSRTDQFKVLGADRAARTNGTSDSTG